MRDDAGAARRKTVRDHPIPRELVHAEMGRLEAVEGAELLDEIARHVRRYVVMNDEALHTITTWIVHVHAIKAFYTTPRLNITSPEAECGKTMLLIDVMGPLLPEPITGVSISPAALYRQLAKHEESPPAVLIDELDNTLGKKGAADSETLSLLLAVLNSGYRRGQYTYRCVGKDHDTKRFPTFAPAAFAGITSNLAHPFVSRSIEIPLQRMLADENVTELEWSAKTAAEAQGLNSRIAAWVEKHVDAIGEAKPARPEEMTGRRAEIWGPLLQVAHVASGAWADRVREAFETLTVGNRAEDAGTGHRLLVDLHDVFGAELELHTTEILTALNNIEDSQWGSWNDGQGIKAHELAKHTEKYRTHKSTTQVWRNGSNRKGYLRKWFDDAWDRYLTPLAPSPDPVEDRGDRTLTGVGLSAVSEGIGTPSTETPQPLRHNGSSGLSPQNPGKGARDRHHPRLEALCDKLEAGFDTFEERFAALDCTDPDYWQHVADLRAADALRRRREATP